MERRRQILRCGQDDAAHTQTGGVSDAGVRLSRAAASVWGFLLAGEEPHDVPVARENTELHQVPEHAQNLQQELLQKLRGDDDGEFQFL